MIDKHVVQIMIIGLILAIAAFLAFHIFQRWNRASIRRRAIYVYHHRDDLPTQSRFSALGTHVSPSLPRPPVAHT
ncbi:hypothetical protein M413DRAFT_443889, partial [Hebeloma cylindrosporum]